MHTFTHSVAVYAVDSDHVPPEWQDGEGNPDASWVIDKSGSKSGAWGANSGRFPRREAYDGELRNVTTVVVEDSEAARAAFSELAQEHAEKFREGRLIIYPENPEVGSFAWWVSAGMPEDDVEHEEGLRDPERLPTPLSSSPKHVAQQEVRKEASGLSTTDEVHQIREDQVDEGLGIPTGGPGAPEELEAFEREGREDEGGELDPQTQRAVEDTVRREDEVSRADLEEVDEWEEPGLAETDTTESEATKAAKEKIEAKKAEGGAKKASKATAKKVSGSTKKS